jgi:hypothetical protein
VGAEAGGVCDRYGGQCSCLEGVTGLRCVIGMVASAHVWRESQDSGVASVGMDGLTSLQPAAHCVTVMLKGPLLQSVTYKRGSVTVNLMWRVSTATAVSRATTTCPPQAAPTVAALGSRPRPSALTSDSAPVFLGSVAPPATDAYLDTTTYPPPDALPATVPSSEFIAP